MTGMWEMLAVNFAMLIGVMLLLWAYAVKIRDVSFIDAFWAFGMVLLAWASWVQVGSEGRRATVLLGLTSIWGLRLALRGRGPALQKNHGLHHGKQGLELAKSCVAYGVPDAGTFAVHHGIARTAWHLGQRRRRPDHGTDRLGRGCFGTYRYCL